jgi:hypothetical protein
MPIKTNKPMNNSKIYKAYLKLNDSIAAELALSLSNEDRQQITDNAYKAFQKLPKLSIEFQNNINYHYITALWSVLQQYPTKG